MKSPPPKIHRHGYSISAQSTVQEQLQKQQVHYGVKVKHFFAPRGYPKFCQLLLKTMLKHKMHFKFVKLPIQR